MVNIDSIFDNGYVEQNLLKQVLKSLNDEIENLKNSSIPYFKFNETIDLNNKKIDSNFKEFIELLFEPKNINNFIILGEYIDADKSEIKIDFISPYYIDNLTLNKLYFKEEFNLNKYNKLFITYQY